MPFFINSNPLAQIVQNNLEKANRSQANAMRRLSSGRRINSAKDNPAELARSNRIETSVQSQGQIRRNIQDGLSYATAGETGLMEIQNLLQRGYELAVQAANNTLAGTDRKSLDQEFSLIKEQIEHIAQTTEIFGKHPLRPLQEEYGPPSIKDLFGTSGTTKNWSSGLVPMSCIPTGAVNVTLRVDALGMDDDIQIFTKDGKHLAGTDLNDAVWISKGITSAADLENAVFIQENGYAPGASYDASQLNSGGPAYSDPPSHSTSYNGMTLTYGGDADRTDLSDGNNNGIVSKTMEEFRVDTATEDLLVSVVGSGSFYATASWDYMPEGGITETESLAILVETTPEGAQSYIDIRKTPSDIHTLGLSEALLDPFEEAEKALGEIQGAMEKVSASLGYYGAKMSALQEKTQLTGKQMVINNGTNSRIVDADVAAESSALTRASIVRQAAVTVLSQANSHPQISLELLKM